ncbi:hypothetical protein MMC07_005274 [Pseudocyphellaria aurata]|nr:hypothetical protein [Pseudocyphellaria aurata]
MERGLRKYRNSKWTLRAISVELARSSWTNRALPKCARNAQGRVAVKGESWITDFDTTWAGLPGRKEHNLVRGREDEEIERSEIARTMDEICATLQH